MQPQRPNAFPGSLSRRQSMSAPYVGDYGYEQPVMAGAYGEVRFPSPRITQYDPDATTVRTTRSPHTPSTRPRGP